MSTPRAFTLGQFHTAEAMMAAARQLRELGYADLDGYTPFPAHGLEEALGLPKSRMPMIVGAAGFIGAISGYLLQFWCNAVNWPINVGGRPPHSPPQFIPITFELGILIGSLGAFFGLWALLGLPRLHHPVFEVAEFRSASIDRFWLSVATDVGATEERAKIEAQLSSLGADVIRTVEGAA